MLIFLLIAEAGNASEPLETPDDLRRHSLRWWLPLRLTRILVVVVTEISLITPPIGLNVFVLKGVIKDVSVGTIFRGVTPFWVVDIFRLILIASIPSLALFLPSMM